MNVERNIVEQYLTDKFFRIVIDKKKELAVYDYAWKTYNFPKGICSDFLTGRKRIEEANDFVLFVITDSIISNAHHNSKKISDFFTEREISKYKETKYEEPNKLSFPIVIPMIQVSSDQWIGTIDVNMFSALQSNNLINYNPDTQRAVTKIERNSSETLSYKITLNKNAVKAITADMLNRIYIPDTITLNIPVDDEFADFYYDNESHQLVIKSLKAFDINDGYHRYVSMFQAKAMNADFNYPMELRITNFDIQKSQRMIYQMDQKNRMTKQVSDSYDVYAPQNKVVQRINDSSMCNVQGFISRNGKIDSSILAQCIKCLYFNTKNSRIDSPEQRREIIRVSKEFIEDFNILTEEDESYLDKELKKIEIVILSVVFYYYEGKNKSSMANIINQIIDSNLVSNKEIYFSHSSSFSKVKKKIIDFVEENIDVK